MFNRSNEGTGGFGISYSSRKMEPKRKNTFFFNGFSFVDCLNMTAYTAAPFF
jgi:hypothetical protein